MPSHRSITTFFLMAVLAPFADAQATQATTSPLPVFVLSSTVALSGYLETYWTSASDALWLKQDGTLQGYDPGRPNSYFPAHFLRREDGGFAYNERGAAVFSEDGKQVALRFAGHDGIQLTSHLVGGIKIWNTETGKIQLNNAGRSCIGTYLSFNNKQFTLGNVCGGGTAWISTVNHANKPLLNLSRREGAIDNLVGSSDGKQWCTMAFNKPPTLWSGATQMPISALGDSNDTADHALTATFSHDGTRLLTFAELLFNRQGESKHFELFYCPEQFACTKSFARLWNVNTGERIANFEHVARMLFSPDGQQISLTRVEKGMFTTELLAAATGKVQAVFKNIHTLRFTADNQKILTGDDKYGFRLWDRAMRKPLLVFADSKREIHSPHITLSQDGKWLANYEKQSVRIWRASDGALVKEFITPESVSDLHFSSSPDRLQVLLNNGNLQHWEIR